MQLKHVFTKEKKMRSATGGLQIVSSEELFGTGFTRVHECT